MSEAMPSASHPGEIEPPAYAVNDGEVMDAEIVEDASPTPSTALEVHDPTMVEGEAITDDQYKAYKAEARAERAAQNTANRRNRLYDRSQEGEMSDAEYGYFSEVISQVGRTMLSQENGFAQFADIVARARAKTQASREARAEARSQQQAEMSEGRKEDARNVIRRVQIKALHGGMEKEADQFKLMIEHGDEKLYEDVNKIIEEASKARNDLKRWDKELTDEQATAEIVEMFGQRAEAEMAKSESLQNPGTIRRAQLLKTLTAGGKLPLPFMSEMQLIAKL